MASTQPNHFKFPQSPPPPFHPSTIHHHHRLIHLLLHHHMCSHHHHHITPSPHCSSASTCASTPINHFQHHPLQITTPLSLWLCLSPLVAFCSFHRWHLVYVIVASLRRGRRRHKKLISFVLMSINMSQKPLCLVLLESR